MVIRVLVDLPLCLDLISGKGTGSFNGFCFASFPGAALGYVALGREPEILWRGETLWISWFWHKRPDYFGVTCSLTALKARHALADGFFRCYSQDRQRPGNPC